MASSSTFNKRTDSARKQAIMVRTVASSFNSAWQYTSSSSSFLVPEDDDDIKPVVHDVDIEQSELTKSPGSRISGPPTVPSAASLDTSQPPLVAISVPVNNNYYTSRQDVRSLVNTSASLKTPSPATTRNVYISPSNTPLESPLSSFLDAPHGSLGTNTNRPRTNKVFSTSQDLAAHYGIPTILPPAPRTTPRRTSNSESQSPTIPSAPSPSTDFASLSANYLNMLNQKPEDNSAVADTSPVMTNMDLNSESIPALAQEVAAFLAAASTSPNMDTPPMDPSSFDMTPEFNNYLTSPWDDSPLEELLNTPLFNDSSDLDMLTGPLVGGFDETLSLFGGTEPEPVSAPEPSPADKPPPPPSMPTFNMEGLYTMSPSTPSLDPSSLYPSPRVPSTQLFATNAPSAPSTTARRTSATGTRKNLTPDALVPLDAPTQPRNYLTPSATSRKEVPAIFARKRARSQAFEDEEDELAEQAPGPNATEREQIEYKRRQNTLAARKSRKRKLEHQQRLETQVAELTADRDKWRTRAETMQMMLESHGVVLKSFED